MTACPIRYQRQVPDRKGKIFYTSITSLSHISKKCRFPYLYFILAYFSYIMRLLFPFRYPMICAILIWAEY